MPIYHFHDVDGVRWLDEHGTDLADDETARMLAMRVAGEKLQHEPQRLIEHGHWRVEVTDERNALLFTVAMLALDAPRPDALGGGNRAS